MSVHMNAQAERIMGDGSYDVIVPRRLHLSPTCGGLWRSVFFMRRKYAVVHVDTLRSLWEKVKCKFTGDSYRPHVYVRQTDYFTAQNKVEIEKYKSKLWTEYRLEVRNPAKPFILLISFGLFFLVFMGVVMGSVMASPTLVIACGITYGIAGIIV